MYYICLFFFLPSYHTMSKTSEPLAASVKHFEKIVCAHAWMCWCISVWRGCAARVVKIRRFLCQQDWHRSFLGSYHIDMLKCELSTQTILREEELTLPEFILGYFLFWYRYDTISLLCRQYPAQNTVSLGSSVCVKCVRMSELNKTDMRPWLWQERDFQPGWEQVFFFFFLWPDDRNVSHCF